MCFNRKGKPVYRFKGFDSALCGDSMSALEAMVNAWMETNHPRIRHVCQSMRGEHILLSFVYEETRELEERVYTQTQTASASSGSSRFFDDDFPEDRPFHEDRPTNPRIPATPPPMH